MNVEVIVVMQKRITSGCWVHSLNSCSRVAKTKRRCETSASYVEYERFIYIVDIPE